jgi:hypothetical protein
MFVIVTAIAARDNDYSEYLDEVFTNPSVDKALSDLELLESISTTTERPSVTMMNATSTTKTSAPTTTPPLEIIETESK